MSSHNYEKKSAILFVNFHGLPLHGKTTFSFSVYGLLTLVKGQGEGFCVPSIKAYKGSEVVGNSPTHS